MSAELELDIHNHLVRYLSGEISLDEFRDWFDPATWEVDPVGATSASQLAGEVELRLAEFSNGHLTEEDLRAKLRPLVESINSGTSISVTVASAGSLTLSVRSSQGSNVDRSVAKVSV